MGYIAFIIVWPVIVWAALSLGQSIHQKRPFWECFKSFHWQYNTISLRTTRKEGLEALLFRYCMKLGLDGTKVSLYKNKHELVAYNISKAAPAKMAQGKFQSVY